MYDWFKQLQNIQCDLNSINGRIGIKFFLNDYVKHDLKDLNETDKRKTICCCTL